MLNKSLQGKLEYRAKEKEAYKRGIKEVVDWIQENSWDGSLQHWGSGDYPVQCLRPDEWEQKLKEWDV